MDDVRNGILELSTKGYGFLRQADKNFLPQVDDVFIAPPLIQKFRLKDGADLEVKVVPDRKDPRKSRAIFIESIQGIPPTEWSNNNNFESLPVIMPEKPMWLESKPNNLTQRIIDLFAPIGEGQRCLIVAPPRSGKTTVLFDIAEAISSKHSDKKLIALLLDERPEEVTEFRRNVKGTILASSFDRDVENHLRLTRLTLEYMKRNVEAGKDVVLLVDSLTRAGRAFNVGQESSGRLMTGGLDARALEVPKKLFGAARKIENGGSLTIIATVLVDTGSRMDEFIFQEFKGTGNMELVLDRSLADERIFPAIDIKESSTRKEEKLFGENTAMAQSLRRSLHSATPKEATKHAIALMKKFKTNEEVLKQFK
ncbi:MAG: transcription termination factor Rho [Calditrichaeota bacterium]|nr:MAG: transcription termination factor Rho [Calditrichota bacterium]